MDRVPLPQQDESGWDYDRFMNQAAATSSGEAVSASYDLAWRDAGLQLYGRYATKRDFEAQGTKKLTPDEANAQYPNMPKPFREDVNPYLAQVLSDQHEEKMKLQQKIENGPDDGWTKTKMFGAGIVAHMMDPLEFGVGAVSGWGVGGLLAKTAFGTRLAAAGAESALARVGFNTLESFTGNVAENVVQEVATAKVQTGEQQNYDVYEGASNAIVSAAFGSIIHLGIKEAPSIVMSGGRRLARNLFTKTPESDLAIIRTVVGQAERDANPDIGPIVKAVATETDVRPEDFPGKYSYEYTPLSKNNLEGKKFYVAAKANPEFHASEKMQIGDERGLGTQMTDNQGVANVAANRSFSDGSGVVWEVDGSKLNPLELAAPVSEDLSPSYVAALKDIVDNPEEFVKTATHGDVLDAMWDAVDEGRIEPQAIKNLQMKMQEKGYNSLLEDGSQVMGESHRPHNLVTLLDDTVAEPKGYFESDPEIRKVPSQEQLDQIAKDANDPLNDQVVDRSSYEQMKKEIMEMDSESTKDPLTDVDKQFQDYIEEIDSLENQGLADENLLKTVEHLKELEATVKDEFTLVKAIKNCVGF